jgi:signal transduction histidine kinase
MNFALPNSNYRTAADRGLSGESRRSLRMTIKFRLPILIGVLLVAVIIASAWASYEGVKAASLEVGRERLSHLTDQLSTLLQQSALSLSTRTLTVADGPALREYLRAPSPATKQRAVETLEQFIAPRDGNSIRTELWNVNGSLGLVLPEGSAHVQADLAGEFSKYATEPYKGVGPIRVIDETLAFPTIAAVRAETGKPIGYLVRWRRVSANSEGRKQLTELLGSQATLYLGNLNEDTWTDMERFVAKAPAGFSSTLQITQYKRDGQHVLALGRPINGTPWFVAIEFSHSAVMTHASRFLRRVVILDALLLLIGIGVAFGMSRSITKPLQSLTAATTAISRGDYSGKVATNRNDELGALAQAFNTMATRIGNSQNELERNVLERTRELEEANSQLQSLSDSHALKRTQAEKERTEAVDALRSTQEQLFQAQKLEAVGRLAGGISHDFNNLLTAIMGYSDLSLQRLLDGDPLKYNLKEIRKASESAAALTRQLLAFSRKQVMQPKVLNLNSVVANLERMLKRMIGEDIELRTSLHAALGNVEADPGQIEQVIMNLAVNARDAMPAGGNVTIETANVYLDEAYAHSHIAVSPGHFVMLAVSDAGMGMDAETQERMFEPFFTTKEAGKGTGLGLSMVYGIVKQSGGNIWVYSELGKGTTFKIYFPRIDAVAENYSQPAPTSSDVPTGSETILLVEDAEVVRQLARQVLELNGYQVLEADAADRALVLCETYDARIDLLLTDVVMPGLSGSETAKRVLALKPEIKVLYMSGYTDDAIVYHGVLEAGLNFIQKPFTPDALAKKVREVLDS